MVDVGGKANTARTAVAQACVVLGPAAFAVIHDATATKGDVLGTARVAGILAAKRCAELIPLCHALPLSYVGVEFELQAESSTVRIRATCRTDYRTGVEMEAMTAASVAALTLYDMCKGIHKGIVVQSVRLLHKTGGKSGDWHAEAAGSHTVAEAHTDTDASGPSLAEPGVSAVKGSSAVGPALRLVYFARVAELTGCRHEDVAGWAPLSGAQLLQRLQARYPALAPASRLNLAVNQQHATLSTLVQPGDEVAVFEPVTGG